MSSERGPGATADATRWLDVVKDANFTVRTLETGRELRFEGPGRVRPCGDEVALVAEGSAVGLPGSGEAPGAEQWVATACGVARWASGVHRFSGSRMTCTLHSSLGTAHLWIAEDVKSDELARDAAADGAEEQGFRRIDAKRTLQLHAREGFGAASAVKRALEICETKAENVRSLATHMSALEAGATSLGALAVQSVASRGSARAACAVAAVRIELAGSSSKVEDQARLDAAMLRWRGPP